MKADFKVTAWERVTVGEVSDAIKELLKAKFADGTISNADELIEFCESEDIPYGYGGIVEGSEVQMKPEENSGFATIEFDGDEERDFIWENAKRPTI